MAAVSFEVLESYGDPTVYFYEINNSCLIAIPSWNWSFLIDHAIDFKDQKPMLVKALEKYVSIHHVENATDVFYDFIFSEL